MTTEISTQFSSPTKLPLIAILGLTVTAGSLHDTQFKQFGPPVTNNQISYEFSVDSGLSATIQELCENNMNKKYFSLNEKLEQFKLLKEDWNGYDAPPIPATVLETARLFLQNLRMGSVNLEGWEVFPTARETIQFEKTTNTDYAEVEIYSDNRFAFYSDGRVNLETEFITIEETLENIASVFG